MNNFSFEMYVKKVVKNRSRKLKAAAPIEAVPDSAQ
jgi:hypothetical protein